MEVCIYIQYYTWRVSPQMIFSIKRYMLLNHDNIIKFPYKITNLIRRLINVSIFQFLTKLLYYKNVISKMIYNCNFNLDFSHYEWCLLSFLRYYVCHGFFSYWFIRTLCLLRKLVLRLSSSVCLSFDTFLFCALKNIFISFKSKHHVFFFFHKLSLFVKIYIRSSKINF